MIERIGNVVLWIGHAIFAACAIGAAYNYYEAFFVGKPWPDCAEYQYAGCTLVDGVWWYYPDAFFAHLLSVGGAVLWLVFASIAYIFNGRMPLQAFQGLFQGRSSTTYREGVRTEKVDTNYREGVRTGEVRRFDDICGG